MKRRGIEHSRALLPILIILATLAIAGDGFATEARGVSQVLPSVLPLDLTRPPATEEIMAAGQLGGELYATHEVTDKETEASINLSFAEAIDIWNQHQYRDALKLLRKHLEAYPESPWASEAVLHMGCDAQYQGRYGEAEERFQWIIETNAGRSEDGARRLLNKARLRLGVLKVYQNNFPQAQEIFSLLQREGSDWRERTYAFHWLQRLSRYSSDKLSMLNCGSQAIAYLLERDGRGAEAREVSQELPEAEPGHSLQALSEMAGRYGYPLTAVRLTPQELSQAPLPAILHIQGKNPGDSGHYWILEKVDRQSLEIFDPQAGQRFEQSLEEFSREWTGIALVLIDKENPPWNQPRPDLAGAELEELTGGCCGVARPEDALGAPGRNAGPGRGGGSLCGSPVWSVNMVNLNLYVQDIPLWYESKIGPSVNISVSYNTQSAINRNEPFGNKWMFNYGSYLVVDTAGNVTVFMPDGKRDTYAKKAGGGYTPPYQVFNTLTKLAENQFKLEFPNDVVYIYRIPPGTKSQQPFLVEIRDPDGRKLTFGYNSKVQLKTITDALGRVTTLVSNDQGLITMVTDPFGRTATFDYDENRNLIRITDMGGYASALSYDENAYLTGIENGWGRWGFYIEPSDGIITQQDQTYPAPGAPMWANYRVTITNPAGDKEEYFYSAASGYISTYTSPRHYAPYGSINPDARNALFYLKRMGGKDAEISRILDQERVSISFGYDEQGNRTSIQDGYGDTVSVSYDSNGNALTITDPLGSQIKLTYNSAGKLIKLVDPRKGIYEFRYSGGKLIKIIDPKKGNIEFVYNSMDQIKTLRDENDHSTTFEYDDLGNLVKVTNPVGGTDLYTYDEAGRVKTYQDAKGNLFSYDRDDLGRVTEIQLNGESIKNYTYDCCRLNTITDRAGTLIFSYDRMQTLTAFTDVNGKTIGYDYDKNGNLSTLIYPDGKAVRYEYDRADRLTGVRDWLANLTSYQYDGAGRLSRTIYPDGSVITNQYDKAWNLKSLTDRRADGRINAAYGYELDTLGNRTGVTSYQPMMSLPSLPMPMSYTHEDDNRLLLAGTTQFDYDDNGNLTHKAQGSAVASFTWDYRDMLQEMITPDNTYRYEYDALGNRVSTTENSSETHYVVDPTGLTSLLAEINANNDITDYYVYGLGLISRLTPSGQGYYYHYDGTGNTIAITDSNGNIVNKYTYDEFGKVQGSEESIPNPFKYVGKYGVMDGANGFLYMRARYYDPEVGRFISKDPIGFAGGLNLYGYVANNPINWVDPEGLTKEDEIVKGSYKFIKYPADIYHGGEHWHVYERRTGKLLGRVSCEGKVLTGSIPKTALKILMKVAKIGGIVVAILLELADPSEAGGPGDMLPPEYFEIELLKGH